MGSRTLDAHTDGICRVVSFDSGEVRFMTTLKDSIGVQSWSGTPTPPKGKKRVTSAEFYRYQQSWDGPRGIVDYYPTGEPDKYHRVSGLLDQYTTWQGSRTSSLLSFELARASAENAAIANALQKAKDQKVNFGQSIGEYKQTAGTGKWAGGVGKRSVDLLLQLLSTAGGMASDAKRGNLGGVLRRAGIARSDFDRFKRRQRRKGSLKGVSDAYLGFIYGIKPLMSDIYGALELLAERDVPKDFRMKVRGGSSQAFSETWTEVMGLGNAWHVTFLRESVHRAKCTLEFEIVDDFHRTLSSAGITNVIHLAYELTTLSFVLDWFVNVGTYLSNLDATRGLRLVRGTLSSAIREEVFGSAKGAPGQSWTYDGEATSRSQAHMLSREPLKDFPVQRWPVVRWPTNLQHAVTAVALVVQRIR